MNVPRSSTETLIAACRELAGTVVSGDGVANATLWEIADRLAELYERAEAERVTAERKTEWEAAEGGGE